MKLKVRSLTELPAPVGNSTRSSGVEIRSVTSGAENDLLRVSITVAGHPAIALIDSGSTHNFISCSWIRKYQVPMASVDVAENLSVTLANGATQSQPLQETISLEMALGEYRCCAQFISFPLSRYDIILGKPMVISK